MSDTNQTFQRRPQGQNRPNKKRFFGFGNRNKKKMTPEEANAETLDRQQSSDNAKKVIESFEEDTSSYKHSGHPDGKLSQSLSFYIILALAVIAVVVTVVLLVLKKSA
jgi:hypothetical protein